MTFWDDLDPYWQRRIQEAGAGSDRRARVARLSDLIARAREENQWGALWVIADAITDDAYHLPDDPRNLVHFAFLRQTLDWNPPPGEEDTRTVLWKLKWALSLMQQIPEVPRADIEATVADVEQVYARRGYALRPTAAVRAELALEAGDETAALQWVSYGHSLPRDAMADCEACERREQAYVLARLRPEEALALLSPVLSGELTCGDEPAASIGLSTLVLHTLGRDAEALEQARRGWSLTRDREQSSVSMSRSLLALARYGDLETAASGVVSRAGRLEDLLAASERMWFQACGATVLRLALRTGQLAASLPDGRATAEVAEAWAADARAIAARFDQRSGSGFTTRIVEELLDESQARTLPEPAARGPQPDAVLGIAAQAAAVRASLDAADDRVAGLLADWEAARERLLPQAGHAEAADTVLLERLSSRALPDDQRLARLAQARRIAEDAGLAAAALRCEAEALRAESEGLPRVREIAAELEASGDVREAAAVWHQIGRATEAPAERAEHLARSASLYAAGGQHRWEALLLVEQAWAVAGHDPDAAGALLDRAWPQLSGSHALPAYALRSRLAGARGDEEEALDWQRRATRLGAPADAQAGALIELGDVLVGLGRYDELEDVAREAVEAAVAAGEPFLLAAARRLRGLAYVETGRPAEGAPLLELAMPQLREGAPGLVGPASWALGNALAALGEHAPARTAYAAAATSFEAFERVGDAAHAQLRAADQAWDAEDLEAADAHFEAGIALAERAEDTSLLFSGLRQRAALRVVRGEVDAGLADLDAAFDRAVAATWPAPGEDGAPPERPAPEAAARARQDVLRQGANLLADAERYDEAMARVRTALAESERPEDAWIAQALHGGYAARAGRLEEAEQLGPVLDALSEERLLGWRIPVARWWAIALDHAGQGERADEVWRRWGPPEQD